MTLILSACGGSSEGTSAATTSATATTDAVAAAAGSTAADALIEDASEVTSAATAKIAAQVTAAAPAIASAAPTTVYSVGTEVISYSRTADDGTVRDLPTKIYYPATSSGTGTPVADGKFPLILFSHGKDGTYDTYPGPIGKLVAAGFIVAAPEYPHTKKNAIYVLDDVLKGRQSLDASQVITNMLARNTSSGDKFFGHLDATPGVGAAGHSLGGFTTDGMLGQKRDARITTAVLYAPETIGAVSGASVKVLVMHGDKDDVLSYDEDKKKLYEPIPTSWSKAFLTHIGGDHWQWLWPNGPNYTQTMATSVDWFRWGMYNDVAAYSRLTADALVDGKTKWETANLINIQVEAESYVKMGNVKIEPCSEGGDDVGSIDTNNWMWYDVNIPVAGTYTVQYRVASLRGGGTLLLKKPNAEIYGSVDVPKTDGWQTWTTVSHQVTLAAGQQKIAIRAKSGGFNLNWFKISQ